MIYTITFNPALDYIVRLDHLKTGTINRTTQEYVLGGGKGINVSIVLNNLGMDTTALGFIAGFTGEEIVTQLKKLGVKEDFIRLREGLTRINVKVKASDEETEINGRGPIIGSDESRPIQTTRCVDRKGHLNPCWEHSFYSTKRYVRTHYGSLTT